MKIVSIALFLTLVACVWCQTLTYSAGWVNGKRSVVPYEAPHEMHEPRSNVYLFSGAPVSITDSTLGKSYTCFEREPQGFKNPLENLIKSRPILRNRGE